MDVVDLDGVSEVSGGARPAAPGGRGGARPSPGGAEAARPPSSGTLWPAAVPEHFGCAAALPACRSTYRHPGGGAAAAGAGSQGRGVQFTTEDLRCLEPGEFLNDTLLDMCLEWERAAAAGAHHVRAGGRRPPRTHVMGTFFYKKLTVNPEGDRRAKRGGTDPECSKAAEERAAQQRLTPAERMHARVQGWTKGVDLFEQDYVIVPIHGGAHWSLAIICHPGAPSPAGALGAALPGERLGGEPPRSPCILHLDSLEGGHATASITRTLRGYLGVEWRQKAKGEPGGAPRHFTCESMPAKRLRCPKQLNLCDCGLFVIENARRFLQGPPEAVQCVRPVRNPKNVTYLFHGYAALEFDSEAFSPWDVAARRLDLYAELLQHLVDDPGAGLPESACDRALADCERLRAGAKEVRSMRSALGVRKARGVKEGAGQPIDLTHAPATKRAARRSLRSPSAALMPSGQPSWLLGTRVDRSPTSASLPAEPRTGSGSPPLAQVGVPVLPDGPSLDECLALSPSPTPSQSEVLSDRLALAASEPAAPVSRSPEPELAPRPKHVVAFLNWGADSARRAPRAAPPVGQQDARRLGTQGEEANTVRGGGSPEASLSAGSFQIAAAAPPAGDGSSLFLKPGGGLGSHL